MIVRKFDEATGIISVVGTGVWTFLDIERHYVALRAQIADLRLRGHAIRLLSDVSHSERQAVWVEDYILEQMALTFRPGDRIALLVGSEQDAAYLNGKPVLVGTVAFASREAAERWLSLPKDAI